MKILNTRILKKSVITLSFLCYLITCGFVPYYYDEATNLCYGDGHCRYMAHLSVSAGPQRPCLHEHHRVYSGHCGVGPAGGAGAEEIYSRVA